MLIEDVLIDLGVRDPGGLDYLVFQTDDGLGFVHLAIFDGTSDPFADCAAFREFHHHLQRRLAAPPNVSRTALIGSYFGKSSRV
ncbi:hypothetical protein [Mycolicibacterium sp. CBMA 226]|uniref:hypothetical protein n=1 Tax=Mycolicibacterium sp. CBMA 226 TaxID=2606611 RepID=UPI0012DCC9C5|nr:hypothetical protein [Mycolicibacterium sp. CBMA 226]MUL75113.1 hypothetical protein [Mycolicibacterium sp. CBMA 226]